MTRKTFLKTAAALSASALSLDAGAAQPRNGMLDQEASGHSLVVLGNAYWKLDLEPAAGLKAQVVHASSGIVLAEGHYSYSMGTPSFGEAEETQEGKTRIVKLRGEIPGGIELQHEFRIPPEEPWVEEQIVVSNRGAAVLALPYARCGFVLPVALEGGVVTQRQPHSIRRLHTLSGAQ